MIYVTNTVLPLQFVIPVKHAAKDQLLQYHLEVFQSKGGLKSNVPAATITPALPVSGLNPTGVPGLVTFPGVQLPEEGIYLMSVYYASNADLDFPGVSLLRVGNATVQRVTPVTTIPA